MDISHLMARLTYCNKHNKKLVQRTINMGAGSAFIHESGRSSIITENDVRRARETLINLSRRVTQDDAIQVARRMEGLT